MGLGADEELLLVEGAEMYGLGNWADMSDHVGGRTKEECEEHYREVYLKSPNYPLPVSLFRGGWKTGRELTSDARRFPLGSTSTMRRFNRRRNGGSRKSNLGPSVRYLIDTIAIRLAH